MRLSPCKGHNCSQGETASQNAPAGARLLRNMPQPGRDCPRKAAVRDQSEVYGGGRDQLETSGPGRLGPVRPAGRDLEPSRSYFEPAGRRFELDRRSCRRCLEAAGSGRKSAVQYVRLNRPKNRNIPSLKISHMPSSGRLGPKRDTARPWARGRLVASYVWPLPHARARGRAWPPCIAPPTPGEGREAEGRAQPGMPSPLAILQDKKRLFYPTVKMD